MVDYAQTYKWYESITLYYCWGPCNSAQYRAEHYYNSETVEYIPKIMRLLATRFFFYLLGFGTNFLHIVQGYFIGTGIILRLFQN